MGVSGLRLYACNIKHKILAEGGVHAAPKNIYFGFQFSYWYAKIYNLVQPQHSPLPQQHQLVPDQSFSARLTLDGQESALNPYIHIYCCCPLGLRGPWPVHYHTTSQLPVHFQICHFTHTKCYRNLIQK